ncbi:hypothetical protein MZD04_gp331 [Pseudomonas phage Psa21]|uniref:Uncharacterized protein n=1 Tax=Pseudomonas phage Psa21 TaxID=2530023 RepID=A0A481W6L8_9CAUD|nr:hypothetical protein MZD04_gp331 [Pseudomonas phage Psa21]QBJ02857.1 hypothetical protein PSA21_331 [Pseudomonas phage Psa21]
MKLLKLMLAAGIAVGMTMCHPVMAVPKPTNVIVVENKTCQTGDRFLAEVIRLIQEGRANIEIVSYLDKLTPNREKDPQGYLGITIVKLNITNVRTSLNKAFRENAIRKTQMANCTETVGKSFTLY